MEEFLDTAEFLGAKVTREAIWDGNRCSWFGWPVTELRSGKPIIRHSMCGPDFENGTSGISYFLGHLYSLTGEELFRKTAEGGIRQALSRLDYIQSNERLSFRRGLVGIAYALLGLATTCEIEKFKAMGIFILEEICEEDLALTVDPSSISALLSIYREHPREFILKLASALGQKLIESSSSATKAETTPLLELFEETGDERFRQRAASAVDDSGETNLSDLTRLPLSSQSDFSLGTGLAGQANLLLKEFQIQNNNTYRVAAEGIAKFGIERYRKDDLPWPCGSPDRSEAPGLVNGLAGIGYMYLRMFDSVGVPDIGSHLLDHVLNT